jgi:hypothetical protein
MFAIALQKGLKIRFIVKVNESRMVSISFSLDDLSPKCYDVRKCYDQRLRLAELGEDDEFKGGLEVDSFTDSGYTLLISFMIQKKVAKSVYTGVQGKPKAMATIEISQLGQNTPPVIIKYRQDLMIANGSYGSVYMAYND